MIPSLKFDIAPFTKAVGEIQKRTDRGTMWGLRETGRLVRKTARAKVRVYSGDRASVTTRAVRKHVKGGGSAAEATAGHVVVGQLRDSIKSGRAIKGTQRDYTLKVRPVFPGVLYAGKIEALDHYMQAGVDAADAGAAVIFAKAWQRSIQG